MCYDEDTTKHGAHGPGKLPTKENIMNEIVKRTSSDAAKTVETKFYLFRQNNSGGSFNYDADEGLSVNVYIEAESVDEANEKMLEKIGEFDSIYDCSCCGPRWSPTDEYDAVDVVPVENEVMADELFRSKWMKPGKPETFVHLIDGTFYGAHQEQELEDNEADL